MEVVPVNYYQTTNPNPSTRNTLGRAVKCFGRIVCKMFVAVPYVLFHSLSLGTEALFGAGGAAIGAVRGGTVKLARAAGSKLGLCEKSSKPLMEYVIKDFHRGTNVGWLPGQIVGAAGLVASLPVLVHPVTLSVFGAIFGTCGLASGVVAYDEIKYTGHSDVEDDSKTFLRYIRHEFRDLHDCLYGEKKEDSTFQPGDKSLKKNSSL
ncbi:hypothetical protein [Endozoicomonas sp. YOMI1]|uniref:hypothetical protein n=1 Tax=Endozoicomonas sp. YOMI1 TaxID=2828739 RepID=UPI002148D474|nr:hypothetical protein [Endozoicomonas sp. YOMI1]